MMNCKNCGGENDIEDKYCQFCGKVINEKGKDYSNGGHAFLVQQIFKVSNRSMTIGKPLQYIKIGDILHLDKNTYKVWNMQKGQSAVDCVGPEDAQVGIVFENYDIKNIKKGDVLTFNK